MVAGLEKCTSVSLGVTTGRLKLKSAANVSQPIRKLAPFGASLKKAQPARVRRQRLEIFD